MWKGNIVTEGRGKRDWLFRRVIEKGMKTEESVGDFQCGNFCRIVGGSQT